MGLLIRWFISAVALYIVAYLVPGVHLDNFWTALIAVVVIGLINALVKPILLLLTLPINILSLGLFTFILNALMLWLATYFIPGFKIDGFLTALLASVLLSIISTILHTLVK